MKKFYEAYRLGQLLPKGEFFGIMMPLHAEQTIGLFYYFYYAKDWTTFQQNVCWARMQVNEGMFVYALNMAVIHRRDFEGLALPKIYEIFPQHFFNSRFIYQAEKFNYDVWSRNAMYEKELSDSYLREHKDVHGRQKHLVDWKTWQWWKLMGIEPRWHAEEKHLLRDNIESMAKDPKWAEAMQGVEAFWMPVDYTRDVNMLNEDSVLTYCTEDVEFNALWYYFNMRSSHFLDVDELSFENVHRGVVWIYILQQFYARYSIARLSHGLGPIEEVNRYNIIETGYNPQLISWNGVPFIQRSNNFNFRTINNKDTYSAGHLFRNRIIKAIDIGHHQLPNGTWIDLTTEAGYQHIASMLHSALNIESFEFFGSFFNNVIMFLSDQDASNLYNIPPHALLNYETMTRDPLFYFGFKSLVLDYLPRIQNQPYTRNDLLVEGVTITDAYVSELFTYFDYTDIDVSNLMNDKMSFVDGQYQWNRALFARQTRLNVKPFYFNLTIESTQPQRVVINTYIGPKFDHDGSVIPLNKNRINFLHLYKYQCNLVAGTNEKYLNFHSFLGDDHTTYTELYRLVLLALEEKYDFPLNQPDFPQQRFIPKGWPEGMPMQIFFAISSADQSNFDQHVTSYVFPTPLGYPLNREINENEFYVPNFFFKDVKVYHKDILEKYQDGYENYGHFDYDYKNY